MNLRTGDFANMGFALAANVPAVLVGDIERGGVIAAIVGTMELLEKEERACLKGYIINKFRGDPSLFGNAHPVIQGRTGLPALGGVPWFDEASKLPEEDVLGLTKYRSDDQGSLRVAVPRLPRISNLDDLDPLLVEPDVSLVIVNAGEALPVCDLVMLIGSKATIADMASLRENGWDIDIRAHVRRSGHVIGLCGGYQMLGRTIADPDRIEGTQDHIDGLGLLDVETILRGPKTLLNSGGQDTAYRTEVQGYQIHMGETFGPDTARPLLRLGGVPDGAVSANGRVAGCYLHGLFTNDDFRRAYLGSIRNFAPSSDEFEASVDGVLNDLADHLEAHLDLDRLYEIAASRKNNSA